MYSRTPRSAFGEARTIGYERALKLYKLYVNLTSISSKLLIIRRVTYNINAREACFFTFKSQKQTEKQINQDFSLYGSVLSLGWSVGQNFFLQDIVMLHMN